MSNHVPIPISADITDEDLELLNELADSYPGTRHDEWMRILTKYPRLIHAIGPGRMDRHVEDELLIQMAGADAGRYELWRAECRSMRQQYGWDDSKISERCLIDNIVLAHIMARIATKRYTKEQTKRAAASAKMALSAHSGAIMALQRIRQAPPKRGRPKRVKCLKVRQ